MARELQDNAKRGDLAASDRTIGAGWDAVETCRHIRRQDVTVREVIDGAIARTEMASSLGAVFERTYDRARAGIAAGASDSPLSGVPTFVKDLTLVRGVPTTWGSCASGRHVARSSDPIAARLDELGLITLGKSACSELGLHPSTESAGFPPCRNPWDPSRCAGGSSGGAATLVAAGVVPIAHGNDGGGSIRIPAACCGVVGLKPSRLRLDIKWSAMLAVNIACDGVLTRTVRDTVAFYSAVESLHPPRKIAPVGKVAVAPAPPLRIGLFVNAPSGTPVDPEVRQAVVGAAKLCETLGHHVEEIACPFDASVVDDFFRYLGLVAWLQVLSAPLLLHWGFDRKKLGPWTRGLSGYFGRHKLAGIAATMRLRRFAGIFARVMDRHDVLLSPTLATLPPPLGYLVPDGPFETQLERIREFTPFTPLCNVSGAPAISLPLGHSRSGLPIGVQFAAAHGQDRLLLELASSLEAAAPWRRLDHRPV
jgi:amidase